MVEAIEESFRVMSEAELGASEPRSASKKTKMKLG